MDPLSHALMGGLAAKTLDVPQRRFWVMVGLSGIMDLDVVANYLGSWASLFQHRGMTHSLLGGGRPGGAIYLAPKKMGFWTPS